MNRLGLSAALSSLTLLAAAAASHAAPVGMIGYVEANGSDYLRGYRAICEQRGIEYDLISESNIADPAVLDRYDVLIVVTGIGRRVGLPEEAIAALKAYLLAGGSVVMEQHALGRVRGLPISGGGAPKVPELIITATDHPITAGFADGDKIPYGGSATRVGINQPEVVKVLGDANERPGLVVATTGRGQLIYSSICLSLVAGTRAPHNKLLNQILDAATAYDPDTNPQAGVAPVAALLADHQNAVAKRCNDMRRAGGRLSDNTVALADKVTSRLADLQRNLDTIADRTTILRDIAEAQRLTEKLTAMLIQHTRQNPLPLPRDCYDMRVVGTKYPADLSPEAAEQLAAKLYSLGANFVLTEGHRQHMQPPNEGIAATRNLVEACHKFGMRVVHHNTCAFISGEMPEDWHKWAQRDARTGEMAIWGKRNINLFCMSNPQFRAEYFRRCRDFKEQTGVDGFMTDEVEWLPNWFVCGCDVCRRNFRQETGFTLPTGDKSDHWGNFDSPLWRAWITARMRWVGDFYEAFGEAVVDDGDVWFGCLAGGAGINMPVNWGDELEEFMRSHNIVFFESWSHHDYHMWLAEAPRMAYHSGAGVHFQTPVLSLFYPNDDNDFIFIWGYIKAFGHNIWISEPYKSTQTWGEALNFERDHSAVYYCGAGIADTAVLFSRRTRDLYYPTHRDSFLTEWRGWGQVMTAANRPYDVILEGDVTAERLSEYKLLILPACACMSQQQADAISSFVRGGGNLIVAGEAGIWDETGKPHPQPLLKHLCGVSVGKSGRLTYTISAPTDDHLTSALTGKQIEKALLGTVTDITAEVLSEAQTAAGTRPFLLRNTFGKGTVLALTGHLGALSNQDRTLGRNTEPVAFKDTRVPEACELTLDLIELAHTQPWPLQAPSTDECGQMLGCLSHKLPSGRRAIVIHQINISGAVLEDGQQVGVWPDDVTYPETQPVEVTLRTEAVPFCAYAISPDYDAEQLDAKAGEYPGVPVELSHQNGETRLQLPALGRYAAVVIELPD